MANEKNLIPNSQRSPSEVRENGRKGGIASGEARRRKRDAQKAAQLILNLPSSAGNEANLKAMGVQEEDFTNMVSLMARMFVKAISGNGDSGAAKFLVDVSGGTEKSKLDRDRLKLEKERLAFEKEKYEREQEKETTVDDTVGDWIDAVMAQTESEGSDDE